MFDSKLTEYRNVEQGPTSLEPQADEAKVNQILFRGASRRRADLEGELLRLWTKLGPVADIAGRWSKTPIRFWIIESIKPKDDTPLGALQRWHEFFSAEIEVMREAHRAISTGLPLEDDKLEVAVKVARRLLVTIVEKLKAVGFKAEDWQKLGDRQAKREASPAGTRDKDASPTGTEEEEQSLS